MMIWMTAKLTEVSRPQIARPSLAGGFSSGARARLRVAAGLAIGPAPSGRPGWVRPASPAPRARAGRPRPRRDPRRPSRGRETSLEVGHEVVEVLEPDRDAEQPRGDPGLGERRVVELAVRRRGRVDDHREDAAERGRQLRQRQGVDERAARVASARELEREHPAAGPQLAGRDLVLGMAGEGRVVDAGHARLTLEPGGECRRRRRVAVHPDCERREAAQREERRHRRERGAGVDDDAPDPVDEVTPPDGDAGEDVAVAGDVFRRRLDDEVRAQLDRPAEIRRGERVVDDV